MEEEAHEGPAAWGPRGQNAGLRHSRAFPLGRAGHTDVGNGAGPLLSGPLKVVRLVNRLSGPSQGPASPILPSAGSGET